eukprot:36721-Eustigmatos_ZCMA.PRE.1
MELRTVEAEEESATSSLHGQNHEGEHARTADFELIIMCASYRTARVASVRRKALHLFCGRLTSPRCPEARHTSRK